MPTAADVEEEVVPLDFNSGGQRIKHEFQSWLEKTALAKRTVAGYVSEFKSISNFWESTIDGIFTFHLILLYYI